MPLAERRRLQLGHIAIPILRSTPSDIEPITTECRDERESGAQLTMRMKLVLVGLTLCILAGACLQGLPIAPVARKSALSFSVESFGDRLGGS